MLKVERSFETLELNVTGPKRAICSMILTLLQIQHIIIHDFCFRPYDVSAQEKFVSTHVMYPRKNERIGFSNKRVFARTFFHVTFI